MAGYSGKPMTQKLGLEARTTACTSTGCPTDVDVEWPPDVRVQSRLPASRSTSSGSSAPTGPGSTGGSELLIERMVVNGSLWVSWPKRSSGLQTDLDENLVRSTGLEAGVVDVKIAAVDDTWSALKFVRRLRIAERRRETPIRGATACRRLFATSRRVSRCCSRR